MWAGAGEPPRSVFAVSQHLDISWKQQQAIAKILSHADRLANSYRLTQESLAKEKSALMQQLIAGRIRVDIESKPKSTVAIR
jgi:hypothetical protein